MWNKKEHVARMRRYTDRMMLTHFSGVVQADSQEVDNVVLTSGEKSVTVAHHCFYGYSRIARKDIDRGERFLDSIEITDEMYVDDYLRPAVERLLLANSML